ncbi:MAG: 30S ribosomal protein S13 [Patescibacteria group bacterium]|jgi:small subunit ribosomal protein S13
MATRIAGITLPNNKRIDIALTYIYGIGDTSAKEICVKTAIDPSTRAEKLTEAEVAKLRDLIEEKYTVEGDLKREVVANIRRLKEIGTYRGLRHIRGLPVNGQRTKTNSRTVRGNVRRTMGSGRKAAAEKT